MKLVDALNAVSLNVWAIVLLISGVCLSFKQPAIGTTLITGGFALLRGPSAKPQEPKGTQ